VASSQLLHEYIYNIAVALPKTNVPTVVTGAIGIAVIAGWNASKKLSRVPAPLVAIVAAIVVFAAWMKAAGQTADPPPGGSGYKTPSGIALVGYVPSSLPQAVMPRFDTVDTMGLILTSVTVAFAGFLQSIAVAKLYGTKYGYEVSSSSEMKAVGIVNMFGAVFQSFVIMGAFSRSAVNDQAGARSPLSQVVSSIVSLLLLLVITPALYYLPRTILAAIVVMAVVGLMDVSTFLHLWKVDKRDALTMATSFLATCFLGVMYGVTASLLFSVVLFVGITTQPVVEELGRVSGTVVYRHLGLPGVYKVNEVKIIKFLAPLYFANSSVLRDRTQAELIARDDLPPKLRWQALILCFASVASIDTTAMEVLEEIAREYHKRRVPLIIASPNAIVEASLAEFGMLRKLGGERFKYNRVHEAVKAVLLHHVVADDLPVSPDATAVAAVHKHHYRAASQAMRKAPHLFACCSLSRCCASDPTPPLHHTAAGAAADGESLPTAAAAPHTDSHDHDHDHSHTHAHTHHHGGVHSVHDLGTTFCYCCGRIAPASCSHMAAACCGHSTDAPAMVLPPSTIVLPPSRPSPGDAPHAPVAPAMAPAPAPAPVLPVA